MRDCETVAVKLPGKLSFPRQDPRVVCEFGTKVIQDGYAIRRDTGCDTARDRGRRLLGVERDRHARQLARRGNCCDILLFHAGRPAARY